jgi:transposase
MLRIEAVKEDPRMAMGKRQGERQSDLWVPVTEMPQAPGHPFYRKLNQLLAQHGFDSFVEGLCQPLYHDSLGRPSIPPGVYFRMLLIGYFEGIDSERGIAWRCADSRTLSEFLGYGLRDSTPDHSSLSRIRQRIDLERHEEVFTWVLKRLGETGLLKGQTIGIDATTLEANAAMRSIVRKDTGEGYLEFLTGLAKASGIETPTREDLAKLDRKRKHKASNRDWENPHDPDAKITKMKDGRTHLGHKAEHAVDLQTGAIVAVTLQPADRGDCQSLAETLDVTVEALASVATDAQAGEPRCTSGSEQLLAETVTDKGYHSNETMADQQALGIRTYCSEPERKGRRKWQGQADAQAAVYANRRRIGGQRGKGLLRKRGELLERPFAHCYETGGMRRTHLRRHSNILKRLLIHVAGFNLGLAMRKVFGIGKPRRAQDGLAGTILGIFEGLVRVLAAMGRGWSLLRRIWMCPGAPATRIASAAAA